MSSTTANQLGDVVIARLKTLINNDLKRICKEEGQTQTGNKAMLQLRIMTLVKDAVQRNDTETLQRMRHRVHNHGAGPPPSANLTSTSSLGSHSSPPVQNYTNMQNGYTHHSHHGYASNSLMGGSSQVLFRSSPFYQIRDLIYQGITLEASPSHRQSVQKPLSLSEAQAARMKADPSLRLLLFSAIEQPLNGYSVLDVAFPSQIEVKINGDEVRANFKGLKNKPGSTRPADITDLVRKTAHYKNNLQVTYALTQKESEEKYNLYIYLVKKESIEDLARKIRQRNVITKGSVLNEMQKKANDPDIEVGSISLSLKDPISTLRITIPIRSTVCSHNQCFDAESFLQLQEQAPTWVCPICNKSVSFEALAVDEYVQEILDKVSRSADQVTIDPLGHWSQGNENGTKTPRTSGYGANYEQSDDDDDDLVEIPDYRVAAIKSEAVPTPQSLAQTPPLPSREPSNTPRTGNKRKSEVIDLTLSDDDEPPRPTKKVAYHTPNSLPDPSRRYQIPTSFAVPSAHSRPQPTSRHSMGSSLAQDPLPPLPPPHPPHNQYAYQGYRQPDERQNYPSQGTSSYPTYLGSSP